MINLKQFSLIFGAALSILSCGETNANSANDTTSNTANNQSIQISKDESSLTENSSSQEGKITITGSMIGGAGTKLYIYEYGGQQPILIDSTIVDENNQFSLTRNHNGYKFLGIGPSMNMAALVIANDGDKINVEGEQANWALTYSASGTKGNEAIKTYFDMRRDYTQKIQNLKTEMKKYQNSDQEAIAKINEQGMAMQGEFDDFKYQFIEENKNNPAVFVAVQDLFNPVADIDYLKDINSTMNKYMPGSFFAQNTSDKLAAAQSQIDNQKMMEEIASKGPIKVGSEAPELNYPGLDGKNISLSSLRGQVVLLDFWASWCGPCRKENPNVVKLYNQYKDKGFTIYSYSLDSDQNKWANAIQKDGLTWPNHVSDLKGWNAMGAAVYGVTSIPSTFLIDADGKIIATGLRGEALAQKLKELLG